MGKCRDVAGLGGGGYGVGSLYGVQEWVEESRYSSYRWVGEVVLGMG